METADYPLELPEGDRPMVRFMDVTKSYGKLTVLDRLNLDIAEGEMVSVIGPSGSGKTTVLRMLMTLETINGGVIYLAHPLAQQDVRAGLVQEPVDADDLAVLAPLLDEYARLFDGERALPSIPPEAFSRLRPESSRPYGSAYVG